ncbi:MAG: hypothetical protein KDD40_03885 [Bdellovibrionales bacterium]|nr:hypothetical protein [Bdellovibrionales bacterium]
MCGIFGINDQGGLTQKQFVNQTKSLFKLSKTRGRDSSGIAWLTDDRQLKIHRRSMSPEKFINSPRAKSLFTSTLKPKFMMGHSRLATNGPLYRMSENQPQYTEKLACIHNGIITNVEELWLKYSHLERRNVVDTEIVVKLFAYFLSQGKKISEAIDMVFSEIEGTASVAIIDKNTQKLLLATNNGSLYTLKTDKTLYFASEKLILRRLQKKYNISGNIVHLPSGQHVIIENPSINISEIVDTEVSRLSLIDKLQRCTKCILPETFPGIQFNQQGVLNVCENASQGKLKDISEIAHTVKKIKEESQGHCISMLSGGRDSCYQLHLLCKELGLNPIAYTYDWGMVTDIARRNAARMCQKLGVEHIIVSANIRKKRSFIQKNILAWIKKPHLGMLPILMAGDKEFLYYGNKIKEVNQLNYTVIGACPFEKTNFKTGFTGIQEGFNNNVYSISMFKKLRLILFYLKQILLNPKYINSSLLDSFKAFVSAYFIKHNFIQIFDYFEWREENVDRVLVEEYHWEVEPGFSSTWRIGDGTAAFYNYAYFVLAGFSEFDTFRSNQIRAGHITREKALELVKINNQFRWNSLEWYSHVVGFDLSEALNSIHEQPSLYE